MFVAKAKNRSVPVVPIAFFYNNVVCGVQRVIETIFAVYESNVSIDGDRTQHDKYTYRGDACRQYYQDQYVIRYVRDIAVLK
jgi:hypothetical protein